MDHLTFPVDGDVTKPPLIAWTALKLYEQSGRRDFIEEVYEPIQRWHNWWVNYNSDKSGLYEYHHPFSSGLDDSPLWDEGLPLLSPQHLFGHAAGKFGAHGGKSWAGTLDAQRYRQGAENLTKLMIDVLWDEQKGVFHALHQAKRVPVFSLFHLLPIFTGRLPETINRRLIARSDRPGEVRTDWPLPTVAMDDPAFDDMQMWRGPTWLNVNYLFVDALRRVGQPQLGHLLCPQNAGHDYAPPRITPQDHNPCTGERPPKSAPIFGWTSAVFIDLAIQMTRLHGG